MKAPSKDAGEADAVRVDRLELGYGDTSVLRDISFRVQRGEIFAVIGASGCGKSTLLKGLIGLNPTWRGTIEVAGEDVSSGDEVTLHDRLAPRMSVLFQSTALLGELTVAENVALPLHKTAPALPSSLVDRTVALALDLVHLGKHTDAWPATLSGGMKRRVGLARAMVLNPAVLPRAGCSGSPSPVR